MNRIIIAAVFCCLSFPLMSQSNDTLFIATSKKSARHLYVTRILGESPLYNGIDFVDYYPLKDEYPYLINDDWIRGSIMYDNQFYDSVYLMYDISTDNVIVENYNFTSTIELIKERIQYFSLGDRNFVFVNHPSISTGFCEILYSGPSQVIAKRQKKLQEYISNNQMIREFEEKSRYFIFFRNQFIPIRNKQSILRLYKQNKNELNKRLKESGASFEYNREKAIAILAEEMDRLNQ